MKNDLLKMLMKAMKEGKVVDGGSVEIPFPPFPFDDENNMIEIGTIPDEMLDRYNKLNRENELLDREVKNFIEQMSIEVTRKIDEKFQDKRDNVSSRKREMWNEISDCLHVSRELNLSLNPNTGMVKGEDKKPNLSVVKDFKAKDGSNEIH